VTQSQIELITMAATGATALAAISAALIAWFQVNRFSDNERAKTTLAYFRLFDEVVHRALGQDELTISIAITFVTAAMKHEDHLQRFIRCAKQFYAAESHSNMTADDRKWYLKWKAPFILSINYFSMAAMLLRERRLDPKMFVEYFAPQICSLWGLIRTLRDVEPFAARSFTDEGLRLLADKAATFNSPSVNGAKA
jgi:hypothetical protein